ncbi:MAG: 2OG-Fe dioxygenase family protein [Kofleriaceae bacterium]
MHAVPSLEVDGFAFVPATLTAVEARAHGSLDDWAAFAASWDDLPVDAYMADGGRDRRRRYARYLLDGEALTRAPHGPHHQAYEHNRLNGGVDRHFEPITDVVGASASLATLIRWSRQRFAPLPPTARRWKLEVHQFRIEARADAAGRPTPEGVHRDGVDHVLALLVARHNIARGTTTIHAPTGAELGSFTLTDPLDAALVDDARVHHGVTPVEPLDPAAAAYRDVLVVTFRRAG